MPFSAVATTTTAPQATAMPVPTQSEDPPMPSSSSVSSKLSALSRIQQRPQHRHKRLGKYILGQTIGEGEFGKVKLAWSETETGEKKQFAIKLLRQDRLRGVDQAQRDKVNHEINALQACRHPHVIRLEDLLQNVHYIGIVLDYASGGDMFTHIYKKGRLDERTAQRLFAQLVSGVHYLHQKGIVHRDLKLENLLLDSNNKILISDFGFANSFRSSRGYTLMKTSCGSPCYAAPEVVNSDKNYDGRKVDVWSVGVILFTFLAGYLPFDDDPNNPDSEDIQLLYRYIATTPLKFPDWIGVEARDLLRRILVVDPEQRAKMQDIMAHRWLAEHRAFLSITPAEHEGSAPWQRRASSSASSVSSGGAAQRQSHAQAQAQAQAQTQAQAQVHAQQPQPQQPQQQQTRPSSASQFSLARSASAAAGAMSRISSGGSAAPRVPPPPVPAARGSRPPVRSSSMAPGSIPVHASMDSKRQSAHPTIAYVPSSTRTAAKMDEVPELGIATPPQPQRLAPATKPRPISFQPQSGSSFELVTGSSLYMPKTSQPRVALSKEMSKSGEMSRPASFIMEGNETQGGQTQPQHQYQQHHQQQQQQQQQQQYYQQQQQQQQQSGQSPPMTSGHLSRSASSAAAASARRHSMMPSGVASQIPRSTSLRSTKNGANVTPPSTPRVDPTVPAALNMNTPKKPEVIPPVRRTSVRSTTGGGNRHSAHPAPSAVPAATPASSSMASTLSHGRKPSVKDANMGGSSAGSQTARTPLQGVYDTSTSSNSTAAANTSSQYMPQSRSRFRLSSALWARKPSEAEAQESARQESARRASIVSQQSTSQSNAAAGAAAAANRRYSAIPVKSSNKESSNLKKKTLNFFKRRSMVG